jgi:hypothetical protein
LSSTPDAFSIYVQLFIFGDIAGNRIASGMQFNYKDELGEKRILRLLAPEAGPKRAGMAWVAAMQKVCITQIKENVNINKKIAFDSAFFFSLGHEDDFGSKVQNSVNPKYIFHNLPCSSKRPSRFLL